MIEGLLTATKDGEHAAKTTLVSVGIPTFNRVNSLKRAVESVFSQDHTNLELIISDNASTDETRSYCEYISKQDNRVHYIRQQTNKGATENFNEVLRQSQGEFFMWLADDDWLDRSYVSQCVDVLIHQPDYSLVGGTARYFLGETFTTTGRQINLLQESRSSRLSAYFGQVEDNSTFYGLMRREQLARVNMQSVLGGDWLVVAAIAFMGKVRTLEDVFINRSRGGFSCNIEELAGAFNLTKFEMRNVFFAVGINVARDIMWKSPIYDTTRRRARLILGCQAFNAIVRRLLLPAIRVRLGLRTRAKGTISSILQVITKAHNGR